MLVINDENKAEIQKLLDKDNPLRAGMPVDYKTLDNACLYIDRLFINVRAKTKDGLRALITPYGVVFKDNPTPMVSLLFKDGAWRYEGVSVGVALEARPLFLTLPKALRYEVLRLLEKGLLSGFMSAEF